ncbi:subtilase family domain-containing protein [Pochonia chlamydosporia 170]|uniref:Subtilase family domain-containing protein n=1 Tax=Pochonia chlamydosporia 170 TaxID=1380566 RepID=A0A179G2L0_METCM|nr:subtilase family domain-containing protein [Pochonia chlamydosporia 170]OAQ72106.1 subtilase family domain-containing protein [Pochonia chlamydosporia 170]
MRECTLRQLLKTVELTVDAKRMIELILCRAALHLVGTRWASSPMTLDTVSVFYRLDDEGTPVFFLDKLFLSMEPGKLMVQPKRSEDILAPSLDEVQALGIVLAQIELGEKPDQVVRCEQEHMQSPQDIKLPVDRSKLAERLRMAYEKDDVSNRLASVGFCLAVEDQAEQDMDVLQRQSFDQWFYERAIEPLERFFIKSGWTWEQVNWAEPHAINMNDVYRLLKGSKLPCRDAMELNGQRVRKLPRKLLRYLKKHQSAEVKIGLEDTGIDLTHPMFKEHLDSGRISVGGCKDFTGDNMKPDGAMTDKVGHGTHLAYAILEATAPQCRLYIARVYKQNTSEPDTEEYVAQATRWLVKECGVEVLIMAFTFNKFSVLISQAIAEAEHVWFGAAAHHHCKVPVLGRHGNMKDTCTDKDTYAFGYPASDPKVSAIYSVDKEGKRSNFSPPGRRCCRNLAIQGEDVEAAWPLALNQGDVGMEGSNCMSNTKLMSGTSQATALVGAHVANVLLMLKTTPFENPRTTSFLEPGKHKDLIVWALTTEAGTESVMDSSHPTPTVTDDYSVIRPRLFLGKPLAECRSRVEKVIEGFYAGCIF